MVVQVGVVSRFNGLVCRCSSVLLVDSVVWGGGEVRCCQYVQWFGVAVLFGVVSKFSVLVWWCSSVLSVGSVVWCGGAVRCC